MWVEMLVNKRLWLVTILLEQQFTGTLMEGGRHTARNEGFLPWTENTPHLGQLHKHPTSVQNSAGSRIAVPLAVCKKVGN